MSIQRISNAGSATLKGAAQTIKGLDRSKAHTEKSLNTGIRVEGFRLKKKLQAEIRRGVVGGSPITPLSFIARRMGRMANRKPLQRLAIGIRYQVFSKSPFAMAIGWVGPETGFDARMAIKADPFGRGIREGHHVSKSWRRLAKRHQEGFTQDISDQQRRFVINRGATLGTIEGGDTPFFLKKSTKKFKTPGRPIVDPFWQANKNTATRNIKQNFKRKVKGQRI